MNLPKQKYGQSLEEKLVAHTNVTLGCWEWTGVKHRSGYGMIKHKGKTSYVHRVVFERTHGREIPEGMVIMHTCDNPACCNPEHLSMGTAQDNMRDMFEKGRANTCKGVNHRNSKLTDEQVVLIYLDKRRLTDLANEYGVKASTIWAIKNHKSRVAVTKNL